jgi:2-polyprenyl-3-methyl-5-hydroxy-6-metoxy-1,4-benzoquinol methylase
MDHFIHYTACPLCGATDITPQLIAKDHTVSGKEFAILQCNDCTLRFTQDVPDAAAISPYYRSDDYISHTNTSKGFVNRIYQMVRKKTLKQKRRMICRMTASNKGSLLDLGSGTGAFAREMTAHGWNVLGLEPDESARKIGKEVNGIELKDTGEFYSLKPSQFDAITMWHVLEHVHDLGGYVEQLRKLLKPNGRLFIAVPNYTSKDAAIYGECWAAYDVPRHLYHFSPDSMKRLMEKHGMSIIRYKPMWYDSVYISFLSSRYKNGKTNYLGAFFAGFRSNFSALFNSRKCSSVIYVIKSC